MKSRHPLLPFALLALVWLAFAAYVWCSAAQLPGRVATHFGLNGVPNGWQTHSGYILFMLISGAAVPALVLGIFAFNQVGNGALMNIPHKDYWLAPERRQETFDFIRRRGLWLAGLLIIFFAGLHHYIVVANAQAPVRLPPTFAIWIGGGFLAAAISWVAALLGHFSRKPL